MSVNALGSVDFIRYFTLLREGLPETADIYIRDLGGGVISGSTGGEAAASGRCGESCAACPLSPPHPIVARIRADGNLV